MNVCQLNANNIEMFHSFIPMYLRQLNNNQAAFGFYDDKELWGAVVISLTKGLVEVEALFCRQDAPSGECEKALADILENSAKKLGIYQVDYVAEGTAVELEAKDVAMMCAGFYVREGAVSRYVSTLGRIRKAQVKNIEVYKKKNIGKNIMLASEMPESLIRKYNSKHEDVPFIAGESSPDMTYFYIENNEPVAVIMASENDEGCLVLDWLDMDEGVESIVNMYLVFESVGRMIERYSEDKKVLVHPFSEEVENMVKHFDFELDTDKPIKTHIYTRYFDIED